MTATNDTCTRCQGLGLLIVRVKADDRLELQRCDICTRFKDDRSAWRSLQPRNTRGRNHR